MLSPAAIAALRADYTDADPTRENPDPRLVAVLDSYEHLLTLAETVRALLPDLRAAEDGSCTVCGAEEHEDDCPVPAVVAALARVSGRRVPGRPAGQRIAEEPTAEARELLGLDKPCDLSIERWSVEETCPDGGWWAVCDRCDDDAGPYPPVALFQKRADADGYVAARDADGEPLAYNACVTPAAILADGTLAVANDFRLDDHAALASALDVATTVPDETIQAAARHLYVSDAEDNHEEPWGAYSAEVGTDPAALAKQYAEEASLDVGDHVYVIEASHDTDHEYAADEDRPIPLDVHRTWHFVVAVANDDATTVEEVSRG